MNIPHNKPTLGWDEAAAAEKVIISGQLAQGLEVRAFENDICRWFGLPHGHVVAVSSGSSALFLALVILHARGKRIGVPSYSCASLLNAVQLVEGRPIFLDTKPNEANFCFSKFHDVDILIAASIFGIPVNLNYNFDCNIIEDIAQSFGAFANGAPIGIRGDLGICSFYATKMFTSAGQGGAIVSKNKCLIEFARDYINFDQRKDRRNRFNLQMTEVQAAVGRVQLARLKDFIIRRQQIFDIYRNLGLPLLDTTDRLHTPVRYRAIVRTSHPRRIITTLAENRITAIIPVKPFEIFGDQKAFPNAFNFSRSTVSLPIFPLLSDSDAERIGKLVLGAL